MAYDYEALVGHLYVVGGRSISATPPGVLVEVAPKKAARGRETDTFFCLVLPSGDTVAPAIFYEEMANLAAERYFASTASVTSGMRGVFSHLNDNLFQHNSTSTSHYEASMVCAVLRGADLYVGKVGSGVALFRHQGQTQPFPADFSNDDNVFGTPLGMQPSIEPKMARYAVSHGTRLLISDPGMADLNSDAVNAAVAADDFTGVLAALKDTVRSQITLLAVEFVPPEVPVAAPIREAEALAAPAAEARSTAEVKAAAPSPAPPDDPRPRRERRKDTTEQLAGKAALGAAKVVGGANTILDHLVPLPKEGQRRVFGSSAATGVAVLIPIAVVVLVVVLWLTGTGESEFDLCVNRAEEAADVARNITSSDVQGLINAWTATLTIVNECNRIRTGDPQLAALTSQGQQVIDGLLSIERRAPDVIETFPNGLLTRIIQQGSDLYVLDDNNQQVYRVTLDEDGRRVLPNTRPQPIPAMRRNGTVNQFTVGELVDIDWTDEGTGFSSGNILVALDNTGLLIDCPPRFVQDCNAQRLIGTETWIDPKSIYFWQGRLYVLDPGANQLWRYDPVGGSYPNVPTEYFTGEGRPDIRNAVDFAIDTEGFVYVLLSNGRLQRFRTGRPEDFGFASFPENRLPDSAFSMYLNTNRVAQGIYFVDQAKRSVYETTLAGTFISSYRASDEDLFAQVADVVVDDNQQIIYAVSGNSILAIPRNPSPAGTTP
jgi:hypothetical protein